MEKYKFEQKLIEAVITDKNRQNVSVLMDGKERKARCHLLMNVEENTPCLVSQGSNGYMVEAVSLYGKNRTNKEWFCINPLLFEHAVCYFLENHYMEDIAGDHGNKGRLSDARDSGFDFETKNVGVEIKIFENRIRQAVVLQESQIAREDLFSYAPNAKVTDDYEGFINEFLERVGV